MDEDRDWKKVQSFRNRKTKLCSSIVFGEKICVASRRWCRLAAVVILPAVVARVRVIQPSSNGLVVLKIAVAASVSVGISTTIKLKGESAPKCRGKKDTNPHFQSECQSAKKDSAECDKSGN